MTVEQKRVALEARSPKHRYLVGPGTGTLALLRRWLPDSLFDQGIRKEFGLQQ